MLNEPAGSSSPGRSTTRDQTAWAVGSYAATDICFPQNLSTYVELPWGRLTLRGGACGGSGRRIAPAIRGRVGLGPHLTLFLHRVVPTWGSRRPGGPDPWARPRVAAILAVPRPPRRPFHESSQVSSEEDLPAEQPPAQEAPRLPAPDANPGGPGDPGAPPGQGPNPALGLSTSPRARTSV